MIVMDRAENILDENLYGIHKEMLKKHHSFKVCVLNAMKAYHLSRVKEKENTKFSEMQYYMEYCQMEGYVTPQEWIKEHKHF